MAEYYPLLAKAVGSLPNSTPESRRIVYERARKALIGQLRTLHPPVPDDDIEAESVALDRAIERIEAELASGGAAPPVAVAPATPPTAPQPGTVAARPPSPPTAPPSAPSTKPPVPAKPRPPKTTGAASASNGNGGAGKTSDKRTSPPLRTKTPKSPPPVAAPVTEAEPRSDLGDVRPPQAGGRPLVVETKGPEGQAGEAGARGRDVPPGPAKPGSAVPVAQASAPPPPSAVRSVDTKLADTTRADTARADTARTDTRTTEAKPAGTSAPAPVPFGRPSTQGAASAPSRIPLAIPNAGDSGQSAELARADATGEVKRGPAEPGSAESGPTVASPAAPEPAAEAAVSKPRADVSRIEPVRTDPQRPIAPQPPVAKGPKRRLWIIPAAIALVVGAVALAAWKLRDHPETIAKGKPAETTPADSSKIAERVGGPSNATTPSPGGDAKPDQSAPPVTSPETSNNAAPSQTAPANNPEVPVAHRAALLVEAPNEPNKLKTFLGTVVWKLNNSPQGPNDSVGLAVEADIDLPDDKMKAIVTFAKNTEASLPASHTINVRFVVDPGSYTGDVKQISVPQMRPELSPSGEALAGVTVQIVPNAFLVGLSPGNAESANVDLMRRLQWIDIPMLLDSGKIAKLTFEKSESGTRDLNEAFDTWQKQ